ncbi:MAG TPA: hypothetical protein VFX61_02305, partial [Micromonosporaceae bacterium]|nr:hypothetical protein [Micromonosporaceae bacterium]
MAAIVPMAAPAISMVVIRGIRILGIRLRPFPPPMPVMFRRLFIIGIPGIIVLFRIPIMLSSPCIIIPFRICSDLAFRT